MEGYERDSLLMQGKTVSFRELRAAEFPPQNYLISHGLLPKNGILVIGGAPKSYKSFTLNSLIYGLATGTPVFGLMPDCQFNVVRPYRVLYLEQEIGPEDCQNRMLPAWNSMGAEQQQLMDENLLIHSQDYDLMVDSGEGGQKLIDLVSESKPDVIVFDPLKEFWSGDENSTREMGIVVNNIRKLKQEFDCSIIIAHHNSKPNPQGEGVDSPHDLRGSSVLFGAGDSFIMQRVLSRKKGLIKMGFTLRRHKPLDAIRCVLDYDTLRVGYKDTIHDDEDKPEEKKPNGVGSLVR